MQFNEYLYSCSRVLLRILRDRHSLRMRTHQERERGGVVVKALCYNSEGPGIEKERFPLRKKQVVYSWDLVLEDLIPKWHIRSRRLVNSLEGRRPVNNWPRKQPLKAHHPQEEWRNPIVTGIFMNDYMTPVEFSIIISKTEHQVNLDLCCPIVWINFEIGWNILRRRE
jgi:hypothetical protein